MQAIARDDPRAPGKSAGVMVDYVGVIQNLQMALAIDTCRALDHAEPGRLVLRKPNRGSRR